MSAESADPRLCRCPACGHHDVDVLADAEPGLDPDRDHLVCRRCSMVVEARLAPAAVAGPFTTQERSTNVTAAEVDLSCWAESSVTNIRSAWAARLGGPVVRVELEVETYRCDRDINDPRTETTYVNLPLVEAEALAWQILAAVDDHRAET